LTAQTPRSIVSLPLFLEKLKRVREQGYAIDMEECAPGSFCIGVPLYSKNEVIGAISAGARTYESIAGEVDRLRDAAEQISHKT